ncbi:MAG: hypothetical protein J5620_01765 [Alphaproteobacteria bacterium]|nr:hypothetical protein [Alphaproteobacteria bacterium]
MAEEKKNDIALVIGVFLATACIVSPVIFYEMHKKAQRANKQVEAYEKTLPGYLEQKQAVEHYRDSLMHGKVR